MTVERERLFCYCGREVAIVRLSPARLAFGHTTNPGPDHHVVRLARPALNGAPVASRSDGRSGRTGAPGRNGARTADAAGGAPTSHPRRQARGNPAAGALQPSRVQSDGLPPSSGAPERAGVRSTTAGERS